MPRRMFWDEPIDFAALAVARSKKGWRPTPAQKAKWAKQRAAKKRKARQEAARRIKADRKLARAIEFGRPTPRAGETFLATFQPGCWYGVGDLIEASGLKRGTVHGLAAKFVKKGILARTKNPAFDGLGYRKPGTFEPQWLYGLNPQMQNDVADHEQRGKEPEQGE